MALITQPIEFFMLTTSNGNAGAGALDSLSPYLAPMMMVLGIVIIGVILTYSIRGKVARRNAEQPSAREQIEAIKNRSGHTARHDDVDAKMAEILETVQELSARLNNRAVRLEQLIDEADRRLEQLSKPLSYSASQLDQSSMDAPRDPDNEDSCLSSSNENQTHVTAINDEKHNQSSETSKTREAPPLDPLSKSVYELSDEGKDPVTIASELDEQVGKVELILALRPAEER